MQSWASYCFKLVPVHDLYPQPSAPPEYLPSFGQPVYTNPNPARSDQFIIYAPQVQTIGQATTRTKLTLELVLICAKDIRNVNVFDDMDVYASIMVRWGKATIKHNTKTPIAYSGFKSPTWNHAVKFSLDEEAAREDDRLTLIVELMSHRPLMGDKRIGKVKLQIQEIIDSNPPLR